MTTRKESNAQIEGVEAFKKWHNAGAKKYAPAILGEPYATWSAELLEAFTLAGFVKVFPGRMEFTPAGAAYLKRVEFEGWDRWGAALDGAATVEDMVRVMKSADN